jgi:hypothetical protein
VQFDAQARNAPVGDRAPRLVVEEHLTAIARRHRRRKEEEIMRVPALLCVGLAAFLISAAAHASYVDGNKLQELLGVAAKAERGKSKGVKDAYGSGFVIGYIAGVADTYNGVLLCGTPDLPLRRIVAIVKQHIRDHPEDLNRPADWIIVKALSAAFPCKSK